MGKELFNFTKKKDIINYFNKKYMIGNITIQRFRKALINNNFTLMYNYLIVEDKKIECVGKYYDINPSKQNRGTYGDCYKCKKKLKEITGREFDDCKECHLACLDLYSNNEINLL